MVTVKRSNGGTVRKHTVRKSNGDTKIADKIVHSDINQNNAENVATSAQNLSNLSESTVQAFHEALHFKPLSQTHETEAHTVNNQNDTVDEHHTINNIQNTTKPNHNHVNKNDPNLEHCKLFQGISLKDFEKHHQLMKEANLEKRRLLSSAIEQR